jgi:hypothetical protein
MKKIICPKCKEKMKISSQGPFLRIGRISRERVTMACKSCGLLFDGIGRNKALAIIEIRKHLKQHQGGEDNATGDS